MRLVLAGCFVWTCIFGVVGLLGATGAIESSAWWTILLPVASMLGAITAGFYLFNRRDDRWLFRDKPLEQRITELEAVGLVERQLFLAQRAFAVREFEDEGLHYFIELIDGRVLFLSGQYLYDYEPISDDPEFNQPRLFPCTEFVVQRHKLARYVLQIQCAGAILEPEVVAPPFNREDHRRGVPEDGAIIDDRTYDLVMKERMRA